MFPEYGRSAQEILADMNDQRSQDLDSDGRAFAFIYDAGESARNLARQVFAACMSINGLDPTVYPSARTIENQVVGACLDLMHAPEGAVGTATTGGTESIMLAVKSARDYTQNNADSRREGPTNRPAILLPITAHACFHKAAHYLGLEIIPVSVDPLTYKADINDARAKMTNDVILVVGSAPGYAHGVIDPIEELAALATEHDVLMHVDACVGGCVLPFMRDNGVAVAPFDFSVPGVTSISMDLHKYGFAPKGVSILLQRHQDLRNAHYYACATWTGYSIVNSTMLGSKSVAALGAAAALIQHLGRKGYRDRAALMWSATQRLVAVIDATPGIELVARPEMNLLAFTTVAETGEKNDSGDLFELADRLTERGWLVQPTYAFGPSPAHIHLTIDPQNAHRVDAFTRDLQVAVKGLPKCQQPPEAVVAMLSQLASTSEETINPSALMASLGITDGQMPAHAAVIHRLLDAASPSVREQLLKLFIGELFS